MGNRFWNRQITRLERAGNDDFLLILTGGARAFATHELHQLLRRLRIRTSRSLRYRKILLRLSIGVPLLLLVACVASLLGTPGMVYFILAGLAAWVVGLIALSVHTAKIFRHLKRRKRLRCIIQQELERRRKDVLS